MPLHPLTVHLPIGLLLGSVLLTLLALRRADRALDAAAYHCLWLGLLFSLPAVAAGTWDAVRYLAQPSPHPDALAWVNGHAAAGVALTVVFYQAWVARRRRPDILWDPQARRGYLALLLVGAGLVVLSGWIGGHMAYALGVHA